MTLLRCSTLLCNPVSRTRCFVKWPQPEGSVHELASKKTILYTTVLKLDFFSRSYKYEAHLLLTIFLILYFPSVHIVHFLGICVVMLCVIFLEVDNFACGRFSLKEWAVTCILQKYFPVKKKSYIGFVCYLNFGCIL